MKKRLPALALCLFVAGRVWALEANSQKLADRYLSILEGNPAQQTAIDRLWGIYSDAGEADFLRDLARQKAAAHPVLAAALLQKAGREAEAEAILAEAAKTGDGPAAEVVAARLAAKGDAAGAAAILEKAVEVRPSPGLWIQLGLFRQKAGEPEKAREAWEQAVALSPQDLGLRRKLAQAGAVSGDRYSAVTHLKVITEHGSPSERFEAWQEISRLQESTGLLAEAISAQESLLALLGPGHWQMATARHRLLELHRLAGTLAVVEKRLLQAVESHPRDPQAALRLAEFYAFGGVDANRLTWLRKALEISPADTAIAGQVAALEVAAGNFAAAAAIYDRVLAERPGDADMLFLRAEVAALSGDEAGAEKRAEEFLAAHPGDETAEGRVQEFYRRMKLFAPMERRLVARQSAAPRDEAAAIELAQFYLGENRFKEAAAVLDHHDFTGRSPGEAADTAFRFSQILKQAHVEDAALAWAKKASDHDSANPEYALHLAELLAARDDKPAARRVLETACAAAPGLPREDLDRRLHLLVQDRARNPLEGGPGGTEMQAKLDELRERVRRPDAGEPSWLRLARWLRWNGDPAGALLVLREAAGKHETSRALGDALATALVEAGDTAGAIQVLSALAERFPKEALDYRRRIGLLELDRGNAEGGLQIFVNLASQRVGEWQAIADLATAEQVAGNWFKALETWERAYGMAPAEARAGIRQPLLNAATRLQLYERALEFLDTATVQEKNAPAREDLLREAAAFAAQNRVAADWHDRLVSHLAAAPGERHWELGKVFLLEAEGRKAEARTALVESQRDLAESATVLEPLLKAAENAEDWNEAARLTRRLMALSRQPDPANSVQLARFLELAGLHDEAKAAWMAVASLHARDPAALTAAAEYFDRSGEEGKMEACYRGAAKFGSCPPQILLRLGGLALERGDRSQALADFEAVLERARPDSSSGKNCLPLPDLLADAPAPPAVPMTPGGWRRPPGQPVPWTRPLETETEGCRLLAIRQAGRLLANSPRKADWLKQFTLPLERIWALYAVGETDIAFAEIEKHPLEPEAREAGGQAYAALLIDAEEGERLAKWASSDPARSDGRWDMVSAALTRLLDIGWRPDGSKVFAGAPAFKRWQLCGVLASRNLYREACALGEGIPDELPDASDAGTSPASAAWLEFARWKIALRDPDGAVECLDRAIACLPPAISLGGPLHAAIRARWLLTPRDLRENFEVNLRERLKAGEIPGQREATGALLAALKGDHPAAAAQLAALVATPGLSVEWAEFIQQAGVQLEEWNLPRLARDLYRQELARDRALLALQGQDFRQQTEALLIANQLTWAHREGMPYLLKEWAARGAGNDELLRVADRLKRGSRPDRAAVVLAALSERDPRDESVKAGLLTFVDDPLTRPVAAAYIEKLLAEPRPGPGQALVQNAALRLAAMWEQAGEYTRCLDLLDRMQTGGAVHRAITQQRTRVLCTLGRHREALEEVESQARALPSAGPGLSLSLAGLYAGFGRGEEARAVLQKEASPSSPDRLAAVQKIRELFPADAPAAKEGPDFLTSLDRDGLTKVERFRAGRDFLATHPELPDAARSRELARLRKIAERDRALLPEFFALRKNLSADPGQAALLEQELTREWDEGRGPREAGEVLALLYLEGQRFAELGQLLDTSLSDVHFHEAAWDHLGLSLLSAGQPQLAARVMSALVARAPGNSNRALFLAEALWKSGRETEARELVFPVERLAAFDPARRTDLARFELAIGNPDAARRQLQALIDRPMDPAAAALWARLAGFYLTAHKFDEARDTIELAITVPSAVSGSLVVDYHEGLGDLATRDPGTSAFPLTPYLSREFQIAAATRLAAADDTTRAWLWLEKTAHPLSDGPGRQLLQKLEKSDSARAARLWNAGLGPDATWEMRREAARFFLRHAATEKDLPARQTALRRAHALHPGSFAAADALVRELRQAGQPDQAGRIYQTVLESYSSSEDRHAANRRLKGGETP